MLRSSNHKLFNDPRELGTPPDNPMPPSGPAVSHTSMYSSRHHTDKEQHITTSNLLHHQAVHQIHSFAVAQLRLQMNETGKPDVEKVDQAI